MCERVQAVTHEAGKRQHEWRRTTKHEDDLGGYAEHRLLVGDIP
jgi:hypothetical protein